MVKKPLPLVEVTLDRIIGGGQAIGTLLEGKKCLVWGGLPGETVKVQVTKSKSSFVEGYVTEVIKPSKQRTQPRDVNSYMSTSPWQIMDFDSEEHYKSALIEEAFELHDIVLPTPIGVWTDGKDYGYRNKVEFSFWFDTDIMQLKLAFFRRGSHGKVPVDGTSLAADIINQTGVDVLKALRALKIDGRALKTLMIRSNKAGQVAWQLYVKEETIDTEAIFAATVAPRTVNAEIIYSNPKSPASVITKRLAATSDKTLTDTILDVPFRYATEGFFQINLPVYEQALTDMKEWVVANKPVVDLYSGVGTIGLTIGGDDVTLVESNEHAVREMQRNIEELGRKSSAKAVLAYSEDALDYIT
ncbi:MAG: putative methyltransferase, partial [Candidatus Saccharibacteria bacterium]|nr:putative methyltransferase [Candidatus Saccharibacteria bacterium]